MSKQTNDTQKALRELTGGSNSEIRQLRKNLAGFASTVLAQQAARPVEQYNPPQLTVSESSLPAAYLTSNNAKQETETAAGGGPLLTFRVAVNGVAQDVLIAATILPAA